MEVISSVNNQKIKNISKLKDSKYRKEKKQFLIEGLHLIVDALQKGVVETIITNEQNLNHLKQYDLSNKEIILITNNVSQKLSDVKTPQNIFAICKMKNDEIDFKNNILILDQLQDPGNLGTLIRSAASFGFKTIIASEETISFYNDKVLRSTQGNLFQVNLVNDNLLKTINNLKEKGYTIVGTSLHDDAKMLNNMKWNNNKYALVIGNEGNGISTEIKKVVDINTLIEMNEGVESLNAGVAGSIIMYNIYKKYK